MAIPYSVQSGFKTWILCPVSEALFEKMELKYSVEI